MIKIKSMLSKDVPGLLDGIHHDQQTEDIINLNNDKLSKDQLMNSLNGKVVFKIIDDEKYEVLFDKLDPNDPDYDKNVAILLQSCTYIGEINLSDLLKRTMKLTDEYTLIRIKDLESYVVEDYEDTTKLCRSGIYAINDKTRNSPITSDNKDAILINSRLNIEGNIRIHQVLIGTSEMYARLVTYVDEDDVTSTEWKSIGGGGGMGEVDESLLPHTAKDRVFGNVNGKATELYNVNYYVLPDKVENLGNYLTENYLILDLKHLKTMDKITKFQFKYPTEELVVLIDTGAYSETYKNYARYALKGETDCIYVVIENVYNFDDGVDYTIVFSDTPPNTIVTPKDKHIVRATYSGLELSLNLYYASTSQSRLSWKSKSLRNTLSYSLNNVMMDFPNNVRRTDINDNDTNNWDSIVYSGFTERNLSGIVDYCKSLNIDIDLVSVKYKIVPSNLILTHPRGASTLEIMYHEFDESGDCNMTQILHISKDVINIKHFKSLNGSLELPHNIDSRYGIVLRINHTASNSTMLNGKPLGVELVVMNKITGKVITRKEMRDSLFEYYDSLPPNSPTKPIKKALIPFISVYGVANFEYTRNYDYLYRYSSTFHTNDIDNVNKIGIIYTNDYKSKFKDLITLKASKLRVDDVNWYHHTTGYFELEFTMPYGKDFDMRNEYINDTETAEEKLTGMKSKRLINRVLITANLPDGIVFNSDHCEVKTIIGGSDDSKNKSFATIKAYKNQLFLTLPGEYNFLYRDNGVIKVGITTYLCDSDGPTDFISDPIDCNIQQSDGECITSFDIKLVQL